VNRERQDALDGLGLAAAFVISGVLCLTYAPQYFDATTTQLQWWRIAAVALACLAFVGATSELQKLRPEGTVEHWGDIGVGGMIAAIAAGLSAVASRLSSPWAGLLKGAVAVFTLLAMYGTCRGLARLIGDDAERAARRARRESLGRGGRAVELLIQVLSLATAVVGLVAAVGARGAGS
jgi:hypothetical protein